MKDVNPFNPPRPLVSDPALLLMIAVVLVLDIVIVGLVLFLNGAGK